jgi:hypothetical protein
VNIKMLAASVVTVVTAVLGVGLAAAGPAAAATGSWVAYGNKNPITTSESTWKCAATQPVTADGKVGAQVCAIRSADKNAVQAAVIVRNNRSSLYGVEAAADLSRFAFVGGDVNAGFYDRWTCSRSGVAANSWSVCFGESVPKQPWTWDARGGANGIDLGVSPGV